MRQILFFLLIASSFSLYAQNVSVSIAPSAYLPLSDYGSTEISDTSANFAELGIGANVEFTFWLNKGLGISFMAGGYSNNLDNQTIAEGLNEELDLGISVSEDSYTTVYGMLGLALGFNSKRASVSIHPTVGYGVVSDLSYAAFSETLNADVEKVDLENDAGLMYGVQFSSKFFLNKTFGLGFNAGFMTGNFDHLGNRQLLLTNEEIEQTFEPTVLSAGINLSVRLGGGASRHRPGAGFYFGD